MDFSLITVTPFAQNCTLLVCPDTRCAVLVDPGGEPERLKAACDAANVSIEKILLTHGHLDHIGAVADMQRYLGVDIVGPHRDDLFLIEAAPEFARAYGFEPPEAFVPSTWLEEGDVITFGNQRLDVLHCPGHAPGHVVFVNHAHKLIQMGDVLFKGSIGRTDLPGGDMPTLIQSIRSKLWPLGDDYRFIPGHGPLSTLGEERRTNPFVGEEG